MTVRFTAEIIDDNGNVLKAPVSVETNIPDLTQFNCPSEFIKVFDRYERPVIEARNQIASKITKDYHFDAESGKPIGVLATKLTRVQSLMRMKKQ